MPACRTLCSIALLFCLSIPSAFAEKPVLVLFPVQVGEADADYEGEFGSALQEGLQDRFEVYYGPAVEAELEKEYQKIDCDTEKCQQNIAISFNGELIGDASAKRLGDGYALKLVIHNVLTGKIVESKTYPCRGCDGFAVIDAFKQIGQGEATSNNHSAISITSSSNNNTSTNSASNPPSIFIFDSKPSGAKLSINGESAGVTPYQGLSHKQGETLKVKLTQTYYKPLSFNVKLDRDLVRISEPVAMELGRGQLLISIEPYQAGVTLNVDGKGVGELPKRLVISAGKRKLQAILNGTIIETDVAEVKDGSNKRWVMGGGDVNYSGNPYEVAVEVASQVRSERMRAFIEALKTVYVRVSGQQSTLKNQQIKSSLKKPVDFLTQYTYTKRMQEEGGKEKLFIDLVFDSTSIERFLRLNDLPVEGVVNGGW